MHIVLKWRLIASSGSHPPTHPPKLSPLASWTITSTNIPMPNHYPGLGAVTDQGVWHVASNSSPLAIMLPRLGERSGKPAPSAQPQSQVTP